jgi:aldose 1-epimerase
LFHFAEQAILAMQSWPEKILMQPFGRLADGTPIEVITLGSPAALQARILTYGGILQRLTLPTRSGSRDLVLSLPDLDSYVRDYAFIGCIIGRYANRIAGASFELDGKRCHLTANDGSNHLHGGRVGFGKRAWKVLDFAPGACARLRLGLRSEGGEEGYPGNLEVSAEFTLDRDQLGLRFEAISDAPTPVNLTYHPYFNLGGDRHGFEGDHFLRISGDRFLPVADGNLIPTGEFRAVEGTPFDFRQSRMLRLPVSDSHPQLGLAGGYDHCFAVNSTAGEVAQLRSNSSNVALRVYSDQPGLQFYGGQGLSREHSHLPQGISLEPQAFPNSPNQASFGPAILRPGQTYSHTLVYRFSSG